MTLICLDSGNSRIKWGAHNGQTWLEQGALAQGKFELLQELMLRWPSPSKVLLANVAGPAIESFIHEQLPSWCTVLQIAQSCKQQAGLTNLYEKPETLGVDRWCALLGARSLTNQACIVVMTGTATTIDSLDAQGNFLGGLILPGRDLMHDALATRTAGLNRVEGKHSALPRSTADAITSGIIEAQAGAIERAYRYLLKSEIQVNCLISGGNAEIISTHLAIPHKQVQNLPLEGLRHLASNK